MITFEHTGGIGMRALYRVRKDGKIVAGLHRHGSRSGWEIYSNNYGMTLRTGFRTIDEAKAVAQTIDYPTGEQAYEILCREVEPRRRKYKERLHAHDLARLARELVSGSNSARADLETLVEEIEAWIADRTHTRNRELADNARHFETTGERIYTSSDTPLYPEPPSK
jgi:hypothetical protein